MYSIQLYYATNTCFQWPQIPNMEFGNNTQQSAYCFLPYNQTGSLSSYNYAPNINSALFGIKKKRTLFSKDEDLKLMHLTKLLGPNNWKLISSFLEGRNPKQCRDRYKNYLAPGLSNTNWSKDEDEKILHLVSEIGSRWSEMQKYFPNRSSNSLKNRWHLIISQKKRPEQNISYSQSEKGNNDNQNTFLLNNDQLFQQAEENIDFSYFELN